MLHCNGNIICPITYDFLHMPGYIRRSGIIPLMIDHEGNTYVLLGLSKEERPVWADLGGRAEKDETTLQTAIREYTEESRGVLPVDMNRVKHILITYRDDSYKPDQAIFIVEVDSTPYNVNIDAAFQQTIPTTVYEDEMNLLRWIPYDHFISMVPVTRSLISIQEIFNKNKDQISQKR